MSAYYRVLSIDGGGIRGIIPALVLDYLETMTGRQVWEMFDMITGTSTGGLLALGLTKPHPDGDRAQYAARDIAALYEDRGGKIFTARWQGSLADEKYPTGPIETVLDEYFGEARLPDALTEVMITAYEVERRRPIVFKRRHARRDDYKRREHDLPMKQIARATSAAPTYFEPTRIEMDGPQEYLALIDGGVFANNPALCGYVEALKLKAPGQKVVLLSLGTGELTHPLRYETIKDWGLLQWARQIVDVVFDGVSGNVEYILEHLADPGDRIERLQIRLDEHTAPLDRADRTNMRALKLLAEELIFQNRERLEALAAVLVPALEENASEADAA